MRKKRFNKNQSIIGDDGNIDNWSFEELMEIVNEYISQANKERVQKSDIEEEKQLNIQPIVDQSTIANVTPSVSSSSIDHNVSFNSNIRMKTPFTNINSLVLLVHL